jgi:DNA-binding response OmpR family regulator
MKILIIEDEEKIANSISESLTIDNFQVQIANSGEDGLFYLLSDTFDLLILDIMLAGRSGLEVLKTIRSKGMNLPVLILSARDTVEDRVSGLDSGADDYLIKPFSLTELKARVRALLRREKIEDITNLRIADIEVDLLARSAICSGHKLSLTAREFELLEYLMRNEDRIVSREMIGRDVWKCNDRATSLDNVIDVHIMRLRRKMKARCATPRIETIRGVGFRLENSRES